MAALTGATLRDVRNVDGIKRGSYIVANSVTLHHGGLVLLNSSGRLTNVPANSLKPAGVLNLSGTGLDSITGDSSKVATVEWGAEWLFTTSTITAALLGQNVSILTDNDVTTAAGSASGATGVTAATVAPVIGEAAELSGSDVWVAVRNFAPTSA